MKGYLYRYDSDCDEVLLGHMIEQQPDDAWIYLEHDYPLHDEYAVYLKFRRDVVEPERYSVGRIFNENFEMRWQRLSYSGITLQLLCEDEKYRQDNFILEEEFDVTDSSVYLWGTHTSSDKLEKHPFMVQADAWIETRIPRPLQYPITGGKTPPHVQIKTHCYHQHYTGILRITRWLALEGSKR